MTGCTTLHSGVRQTTAAVAAPAAAPAPPPSVQGPGPGPALSEPPQADDTVLLEPELYRAGPAAAPLPPPGNGQYTLNFANAAIREVVDSVLGDILRVSYVFDSRIEGTVTLRTPQPVNRAAALTALEGALRANGAALVINNGVYSVVRLEDASSFGSSAVGNAPAGYGTHVIEPRYVSAAALQTVLQPFVKQGRLLRAEPQRNFLLFQGPGNEARELQELVNLFDVDWMAGRSFGLFPVRVANLDRLVEDLRVVFAQGSGPQPGALQFLPIERMNAILVITPASADLDRVQQWITRLDRGAPGAGQRIYVYRVQNGRAAELAQVLGGIFAVQPVLSNASSAQSLLPLGAEPVTIGPTAPPDGGPASSLGGQPAGAQSTQAVPTPALPPIGGMTPALPLVFGSTTGGDTGLRIIADENRNMLVVLGTSAQWAMIEDALSRLDVMPLQVMIEATIAEVSLNDNLRHGIEWFFQTGDSSLTFSRLSSGAVASQFPGFSYLLQAGDVRGVINALSSVTDVKIISSPQLMVLDSQTARLQVGDEVPIPIQQATSVINPDAPIVNTIQFRETGTILEVTPRVNESGLVLMDIVQEISDAVRTSTSDLDAPTIQRRYVRSSVAVQSGASIALGGLISERDEQSFDGIPLLSAIPLLGELFQVRNNVTQRTEILVMLTPRVLRDSYEASVVTDELRRRMQAIIPLGARVNPISSPTAPSAVPGAPQSSIAPAVEPAPATVAPPLVAAPPAPAVFAPPASPAPSPAAGSSNQPVPAIETVEPVAATFVTPAVQPAATSAPAAPPATSPTQAVSIAAATSAPPAIPDKQSDTAPGSAAQKSMVVASAAPPPASTQQVAVLPPTAPSTTTQRASTKSGGIPIYYVQAGAFSTEERAGQMAQKLNGMGARVTEAVVNERVLYRVRIGPYPNVQQANDAMTQAQSLGQQDLRLVVE